MKKGIAGASLLVVPLVAFTGCATHDTKSKYQWSRPGFDDPVCGAITLKILDAFHIAHPPDTIPYKVWTQWDCIRTDFPYGRITLVLLWEPKSYRLTMHSDKDGNISSATTDPDIYQEVIGNMAIYGRVDSYTDVARKDLAKDGYLKLTMDVAPR